MKFSMEKLSIWLIISVLNAHAFALVHVWPFLKGYDIELRIQSYLFYVNISKIDGYIISKYWTSAIKKVEACTDLNALNHACIQIVEHFTDYM